MLLIFFPLIVAKKPISETLFHHYSYIAMDGHTIQHSVLSAPVHESSSGKFRENILIAISRNFVHIDS